VVLFQKKYFWETEKFFLVGWSQLQCFYPVPRGNNFAACEQYFFAYFLGHSIFQKGSILELLWMLVKSESPVDRWCIISPYFVGLSTILFGGFDRISQPVWSSGMTFHEANHPVTGRAFLKRGLGFINISRDWWNKVEYPHGSWWNRIRFPQNLTVKHMKTWSPWKKPCNKLG